MPDHYGKHRVRRTRAAGLVAGSSAFGCGFGAFAKAIRAPRSLSAASIGFLWLPAASLLLRLSVCFPVSLLLPLLEIGGAARRAHPLFYTEGRDVVVSDYARVPQDPHRLKVAAHP